MNLGTPPCTCGFVDESSGLCVNVKSMWSLELQPVDKHGRIFRAHLDALQIGVMLCTLLISITKNLIYLLD